jgi:GT2 family glycosyltransferase
MEPVISILICSLCRRHEMLARLENHLMNQIIDCLALDSKVEVLIETDNGERPTGTKRNILMEQAKGKYVVFVDDDDWVPNYYIEELLKAAESDKDAFAINGSMTTNGRDEVLWYISKDNEYKAKKGSDGNTYYVRWPNHITPIRASIAKQFMFQDISYGEDYAWSVEIRKSGLIQTETLIGKPMYHYRFNSK